MAQDLDPLIARTDDFKLEMTGTLDVTYDEVLADAAANLLGGLQQEQGALDGVVNTGSGGGGDAGRLVGSITSDPYEVYDDIEAILAAEGTLDPDTTNFGIQ